MALKKTPFITFLLAYAINVIDDAKHENYKEFETNNTTRYFLDNTPCKASPFAFYQLPKGCLETGLLDFLPELKSRIDAFNMGHILKCTKSSNSERYKNCTPSRRPQKDALPAFGNNTFSARTIDRSLFDEVMNFQLNVETPIEKFTLPKPSHYEATKGRFEPYTHMFIDMVSLSRSSDANFNETNFRTNAKKELETIQCIMYEQIQKLNNSDGIEEKYLQIESHFKPMISDIINKLKAAFDDISDKLRMIEVGEMGDLRVAIPHRHRLIHNKYNGSDVSGVRNGNFLVCLF